MKTNALLVVPALLAVSLCARADAPATAVAAAPAVAPAAAASDATISIRDFSFAPTSTTVAVGTTVRWKNLDGEPHTVRSVDSGFRSDPLDQNDSFAFKFDKPGTYRYVCSIHPQMVGTIVVKETQ
jgi:plastocyanin